MRSNNINGKINIGVISFPVGQAFIVPLSNLCKILCNSAENVYVMTGNGGIIRANATNINDQIRLTFIKQVNNVFIRIFRYFSLHIKISIYLIALSRKINFVVFFMEDGAVFPMIIAKLFRKHVVWSLPSNISKQSINRNSFIELIVAFSKKICCVIPDNIVVYSSNLIKEWDLQKYRQKILIAHEQFLEINKYEARHHKKNKTVIGFVGRLSEEKGILNFIKAIPIILQMRSDVNFIIGGDGPLKNIVVKYLTDNNLLEKVELSGWIDHETLPIYLSKISLLVLPSYTEGLPNIMLEAMACGTPVLATRVGAIIDVINNNDTGLLMKNNSPECISENVLSALERNDLEQISQNALNMVKDRFSFHTAVEDYDKVLSNIKH
jgi:glycosyltransferase involved in cell wall biosynthesis